ncbi:MAG TPA: energy transducer TonB [Longimicrobium sp.]
MDRFRAVLLPALLLAAAATIPARAQDLPPAPVAPPAQGTYELFRVEEQPMLENREDVARLIQRNYPPGMRSRGESGTATVRFRIQTDDGVDSASVTIENTASAELSKAAAKVAREMRFRPARIDGRAVPVWVTLPITFRPSPQR